MIMTFFFFTYPEYSVDDYTLDKIKYQLKYVSKVSNSLPIVVENPRISHSLYCFQLNRKHFYEMKLFFNNEKILLFY